MDIVFWLYTNLLVLFVGCMCVLCNTGCVIFARSLCTALCPILCFSLFYCINSINICFSRKRNTLFSKQKIKKKRIIIIKWIEKTNIKKIIILVKKLIMAIYWMSVCGNGVFWVYAYLLLSGFIHTYGLHCWLYDVCIMQCRLYDFCQNSLHCIAVCFVL
jgi:hypothetical protein